MKTKKYKTLKGLMKATNHRTWSARDMARGEAWFPSENKTCAFELPSEVVDAFWEGLAKVVWKHPTARQIRMIRYYQAGIMDRLWWNGRYYEYCAGQDYPGEIRFIQNKINRL